MKNIYSFLLFALISFCAFSVYSAEQQKITKIWLTFGSNTADRITVNWISNEPGDSVVQYGPSDQYGKTVRTDEKVRLHHVEIPLDQRGAAWHYCVSTGKERSDDAVFTSLPTEELRVAVFGDWHCAGDISAIVKDKVHFIMSAGDNIPSLRQFGGEGNRETTKGYEYLIGNYPDLFRSIPFMPVLGNHDREIRDRGKRYPPLPSYDPDAYAFCQFFRLPDPGWRWSLDIPEFPVRFIALDLNHVYDFGTTWQTCHPFDADSDQYRWYRDQMKDAEGRFTITVQNERSSSVRDLCKGIWGKEMKKSTICVSGFGYFAERAEHEGGTWYNISLHGKGARYPDPYSQFFQSRDSYLLITLKRAEGTLSAEIKDLDGICIDRKVFSLKKK
ncbi:MAG: metallophosphoesterase [Planctomycetia bacterium]|nr:metallophosphoesterase [Planctomycetia bacterium]